MNKAITKKEALAKVLGFDAYDVDEIDETGENRFEVGDGKEYLVLTEKEKDEELAENIKQSAWAFNAWFIADHSAKGVTGGQDWRNLSMMRKAPMGQGTF